MIHSVAGVNFEITLDSKNKIFRFESKDAELFDIREKIQDQNIQNAIVTLYNSVPEEGYALWWKAILALKSARGEKILFYENPKRDQIICRCQGYALTDLEKLISQNQLSKKEVMLKTNIGLTCTECREQVDSLYQSIELRHQLINGKTYQEWTKIILMHIDEFPDYSGLEINGTNIQVERINFPELKLNTSWSGDITIATKRLENFLSGKLEQGIVLELAVLS